MKRLTIALLVSFVVLATSSVGATDPFTFTAESRTLDYCPICGGVGTFQIDLIIAEDPAHTGYPMDTQGFAMGLAYDAAVLDLVGASTSPYLPMPDFVSINIDPVNGPGLVVGVIYSLVNSVFVPFDVARPAVVASFGTTGALAGNHVGTATQLTWTDALGSPVIANSVVCDGWNFGVDFVNGTILLVPEPGESFVRGDCNGDGAINIIDPTYLGVVLFAGGGPITCDSACDVNNDGALNIADAVYAFNFLFASGSPPMGPFPECGIDHGGLDCVSYAGCP